jgi:hypothetical protein
LDRAEALVGRQVDDDIGPGDFARSALSMSVIADLQ